MLSDTPALKNKGIENPLVSEARGIGEVLLALPIFDSRAKIVGTEQDLGIYLGAHPYRTVVVVGEITARQGGQMKIQYERSVVKRTPYAIEMMKFPLKNLSSLSQSVFL